MSFNSEYITEYKTYLATSSLMKRGNSFTFLKTPEELVGLYQEIILFQPQLVLQKSQQKNKLIYSNCLSKS